MLIMLPIGGSCYPWLDFLEMNYSINMLDIFSIILVVITLFSINLKKEFSKREFFFGILIVIFSLFIIIFLIVGYNKFGQSAFRDSFNYIVCFFYIFFGYKLIDIDYSLSKIMKLIIVGLIGYTIITLITFFAFNSNETRVSGNAFSLFIIVVPFEIYSLFYNNEKIKWPFITGICFIINSLISQDRTVVILTVFISIIVTLYLTFKTLSKRSIILLFTMTGFMLMTIFAMIFFESSIISRIVDSENNDTVSGRIYTFNYYWNLIMNNKFGFGFGYEMYFINKSNYMLPNATHQVDNALVVCGVKGGLLFALIVTILALVPVFNIKVIDKKYRFIFLISYLGLFISAYVMTCQIISGAATAMYMWTMVGVSIKRTGIRSNSHVLSMNEGVIYI